MAKAVQRLAAFTIDPGSATGELRASLEQAFHATMDAGAIADSVLRAYPGLAAPTQAVANEVVRAYPRLIKRWDALCERRRIEVLCFFAERGAKACGPQTVATVWPAPQTAAERHARAIAEGAQRQLLWEPASIVVPVPSHTLTGSTALGVHVLMSTAGLSTLEWIRVWVMLAVLGPVCGADPL